MTDPTFEKNASNVGILAKTDYCIEVFFDSLCPLCLREINMLKRWDKKKKILFTDIADPEFSPANYGKTMDELMAEIHGRLPDGSWMTGVEVFRVIYGQLGFGWMMPMTRIPGISHLLDFGYNVFAKNRLKWTGRCSADGEGCKLPVTKSDEKFYTTN